jgi:predicted O-methyltransferase YrrM
MIKTAIKYSPETKVEYYGFDFFHSYSVERIREKLEALNCSYRLFKGNSLDTIPEVSKLLPMMDIIFIDGGKSYREAWSDWQGSSKLMHEDTGVFIHNVDFYGVGRMVNDISRDRFIIDVWNAQSEGRVALIKKK